MVCHSTPLSFTFRSASRCSCPSSPRHFSGPGSAGRVTARAWVFMVALQALLLASSLVAINTGRAEEDRVENVVQEAALEQHEEAAEQFAWAGGATLVLVGARAAVRQVGRGEATGRGHPRRHGGGGRARPSRRPRGRAVGLRAGGGVGVRVGRGAGTKGPGAVDATRGKAR